MNVAIFMKRSGSSFPDNPAIAKGMTVLKTYGELAERVSQLAFALKNSFNLQSGDRVALTMNNCPEYFEILYACWHAGLVTVPINSKLHKNEFAYILEDSHAKICFSSHALIDTISSLTSETLSAAVDISSQEYGRLFKSDKLSMVSCESSDPAWLFYTSGTSGKP